MKLFTLKKLLFFTFILLSLTNCTKDDDNNSQSGDEYLTAVIDGNNFAAAQDPATIVGAQSVNGVLAVQGGTNSGTTINFVINNYNGVGIYKTGESLTSTSLIQYLELNPFGTWGNGLATAAVGGIAPGTIEITADDGAMVEGTFSFDGYNAEGKTTKQITQGKFKALFD